MQMSRGGGMGLPRLFLMASKHALTQHRIPGTANN